VSNDITYLHGVLPQWHVLKNVLKSRPSFLTSSVDLQTPVVPTPIPPYRRSNPTHQNISHLSTPTVVKEWAGVSPLTWELVSKLVNADAIIEMRGKTVIDIGHFFMILFTCYLKCVMRNLF